LRARTRSITRRIKSDAEFVDRTHIRNRHTPVAHENFLERVDGADAEQVELVAADRDARLFAEQIVKSGLAA